MKLRDHAYPLKSALRTAMSAFYDLEQMLLVEEKREQDAEKLLQSALELVRDQQVFIATIRPYAITSGFLSNASSEMKEMQALDARASTVGERGGPSCVISSCILSCAS